MDDLKKENNASSTHQSSTNYEFYRFLPPRFFIETIWCYPPVESQVASKKERDPNKDIRNFTEILMLASIFSLLASVQSCRFIGNQASIMQTDDRPWIGVPKITWDSFDRKHKPRFNFIWTNVGKSPTEGTSKDWGIVRDTDWKQAVNDICGCRKRAGLSSYDRSFSIIPTDRFIYTESALSSLVPDKPHIAGCMSYAWGGDLKQTGFVAPLKRQDNGSLTPADIYTIAISKDEEQKPKTRLDADCRPIVSAPD